MFERFTDRARRVLVLAQEQARLLDHSFIGTEHLLLGLIDEGDGLAARSLASLGISLEAARAQVIERVGPASSSPTGSPPFTPRAKKVLELSLREALQLGHNYIGTEHILLGLVREGEGIAAQVLVSLGADLTHVRQVVIQQLGGYEGREPRRAMTTRMFPEGSRVRPAGKPVNPGVEWNVQVVRPGRLLDDCGRAYAELAALVDSFGLSLQAMDPSEIALSSVETTAGPGIMLSLQHRMEDEESEDDPLS